MTTAAELDERYGRRRAGRLPWIVGIAVAAIIVMIGGWFTVSGSLNSIDADDLGYEVVDEYTVEVRFQITDPRGQDVVCAVEALDEEFAIVGWKIVEVPAGESHTQALSARIPTVAEATTGLVNSCWVA